MKNILNFLILYALGFLFFSCEKDELKAIMNTAAKPGLNLSATNVTLAKDKADANALTLNWTKPDLGYDGAVQYRLLIDKTGNTFKTPQVFAVGTATTKSWSHRQMNGLLQAMGFKPNEAANLEIMVESILSPDIVKKSDVVKFATAAYLDRLDLSTTWGLVGSATPGSWDGPDIPFYKTNSAGIYVCYATLVDGDIKIRENNKWDLNYGDTGANGTLEVNGDNIGAKAGSYKITFDSNKLTIAVEKYSWGIVGSGAPNGWNGPDVDFFYDPATDQFRALASLGDGEIKIRKSNDWGLNYGDNGANGTLEKDGANIAVAKGVYLITFNHNDLTIKIEKTSIPGIVGSAAPNGWNGPDVQMKPDFFKDAVWVAKGVKLAAGEMKFRMNNDWGVNYGDDGLNGTLELNGANIPVTSAGTYDIELNLFDPAKPTYTIKKK
jgi:starch-binding outer membrane protein SusE/F